MNQVSTNELITLVDVAFAKLGHFSGERSQRLMTFLAILVKDRMDVEQRNLLEVAIAFCAGHAGTDDLRSAKQELTKWRMRAIPKVEDDPGGLVEGLLLDSLSLKALSYAEDAPVLSHAIWWLAQTGVPIDAIKDVFAKEFFPIRGGTGAEEN